jgi:ribosome-associated heat shock protein Hsp15
MNESQRADKWLWCVRLYKTRSLAADACKGGKVKLNSDVLKPAKDLKPGDVISFRFGAITKTVKVLGFPPARVGAKLVSQFMEDLTPEEEYIKLKEIKELGPPVFHTGKGRPTKRDRRKMNDFF